MSKRDRKLGPVRLDQIPDGVLEDCGLTDRLAERTLLEVWPELVGARLADHVRAVDLREGVLFLQADHGAWRQEATMLLPQIHEACQARFGKETVQEIRWARAWTRGPRTDNQR